MLIAFVLIASQRQAKIDFDAMATQVGPLIARLSKQTGTKLTTSAKLGQQVLFVHAKGVTLDDLKTQIASALDAKWSKSDDRELLERTGAQDTEILKAHLALRRKWVDEGLKSAEKAVAEPFDAKGLAVGLSALPKESDVENDPAAARRRYLAENALVDKGPANRLLSRLVLGVNRDDLAAVGPYERKVFTLNPTKMQKQIDPKVYANAIASFAKEQTAWHAAADSANFPSDGSRMVGDPRSQGDLEADLGPLSLVVRRGDMSALFSVSILQEGKAAYFNIIASKAFASPDRLFLDASMSPKPPDPNDPILQISPQSTLFQERMTEAFTSQQPNAPKPETLQLLLAPDSKDILSFTTSDALLAFATVKKMNLVASIPDMAASIVGFVTRERPPRVGELIDALVSSGTVQMSEQGDWTLVKPADRVEADLTFTPRSAIAGLVNSAHSKGRLDVRDYATYAFKSDRISRTGIGDWYLMMLDRALMAGIDNTDWNGLRLFGSFSETEQQRLMAGDRFPFQGLRAAQRTIVERIVYSDQIQSEIKGGGGISQITQEPVEPTRAFASGLPTDGGVKAQSRNVKVLVAYGKGTDGKVRPMRGVDPNTLAYFESNIVGNPTKMSQYGVPNLVGYALGTNTLLTIRVELAPSVWKEIAMTVPDFDVKATPVPWDKLPEPFVTQIKQGMEQEKKNKAAQGKTNIPPRSR